MGVQKMLLVVGAGPGVGLAVARRFGREGFAVHLVGRDVSRVRELTDELVAEGITAGGDVVDLHDEDDIRRAVTAAGEEYGRIDALHFNPSVWRARTVLELTVAELLEDVASGAGAFLAAIQAARPFLSSGGRITVTGSMAADAPSTAAPSLGVQKAALRVLTQTADETLRDDGIRAAMVQVNGALSTEGRFAPSEVAESIWRAAVRGDEDWSWFLTHDG